MAFFVLTIGFLSFVFVRLLAAPALAPQQFRATRQVLRALVPVPRVTSLLSLR